MKASEILQRWKTEIDRVTEEVIRAARQIDRERVIQLAERFMDKTEKTEPPIKQHEVLLAALLSAAAVVEALKNTAKAKEEEEQ